MAAGRNAGGLLEVDEDTLNKTPGNGVIRWEERRHNGLDLTVQSNGAGLLVLREMWAPGWRATVNGHPKPVLRAAGGLLRAVEVPQGTSQVKLIYRPMLSVWLLVGAGVVAALCLV